MTTAAVATSTGELRCVSVAQAALSLGVSKKTIRRLIAKDRILSVRLGRRVVVPSSILEAIVRGGR